MSPNEDRLRSLWGLGRHGSRLQQTLEIMLIYVFEYVDRLLYIKSHARSNWQSIVMFQSLPFSTFYLLRSVRRLKCPRTAMSKLRWFQIFYP